MTIHVNRVKKVLIIIVAIFQASSSLYVVDNRDREPVAIGSCSSVLTIINPKMYKTVQIERCPEV